MIIKAELTPEDPYYGSKTRSQWKELGYIVNEEAVGRWMRASKWYDSTYLYFSIDEVHEITPEEMLIVIDLDNIDPSKIICLDCETTGIAIGEDEIVQLSIIDLNGEVIFSEYIKPHFKIEWPEAEAVNKISPEMVQKCPYMDEYISKINEIMDMAELIVGYNLEHFDLPMMGEAGIVIPENAKIYDVMKEYVKYCNASNEGRPVRIKLAYCAKHFGYQWQGEAHDALEDCLATIHCFKGLQTRIKTRKEYSRWYKEM